MQIRVEPCKAPCGARITGVDLSVELSDEAIAEIRAIWLEHLVVAFPGQALDLDGFERIAQRFGPFGVDPYLRGLDDHPHIGVIQREADETSPIFAESWHSDWSFLPTPPAATMLYGRVIPPVGGDTLYANQHAALDALDATTRTRIEGLMGIHSARRGYAKDGQYGTKDVGRSMRIVSSDEAMATQLQPLVREHPETGRPALFVSPGYTIGIDGMDDAEAQPLLVELFKHQTRPEFVYRHLWEEGLVTMWDNRAVVHAATGGYDGHRRLLHRITIAERL